MRSTVGIVSGLAAIAGALAAMGAAPVPAPTNTLSPEKVAEAEAAFAKKFPTPRLYRSTMTRSWGGGPNTIDMCMGAASLGNLMRDATQRRPATPTSVTGCTMVHKTHTDGSFYNERTCSKQAGAARTSHMVAEGTRKDMRMHMEFVPESSPSDEPRIISTDTHSVDIGPCPANMKQGQVRGPNGQITDPMADMASRVAEAKARKDGSPAK